MQTYTTTATTTTATSTWTHPNTTPRTTTNFLRYMHPHHPTHLHHQTSNLIILGDQRTLDPFTLVVRTVGIA